MEIPTVKLATLWLEKVVLQSAAFYGGALAESRLALLQYKREQPHKV
jgi:hypothetical protein